MRAGARRVAAAAKRVVQAMRWGSLTRHARAFVQLVASPARRVALARHHLTARVRDAHRRRHLPDPDAIALIAAIEDSSSAAHLADFGVHLAIKPVVKALEYGVVPVLLAFGALNLASAAFLIAFGGSLARGLYTTVRCGQAVVHGEPVPWTAWALSFLPVLGNLAYPVQLARTGAPELSRFVVLDGAAGLGRVVPIWGGPDTLLEHLPNRVAAFILRRWPRPIAAALHDADAS